MRITALPITIAAAAAAFVLLVPFSAEALGVTISWSTVGDPGNAPDPATDGLCGAVNYVYDIGTYDVTTGQYTALLNAVAASDPYGLYYSGMATDLPTAGIARSGSAGSYSYSVIGNPNMPAFDTSWGDAARMANWMQNGQPNGAEGMGTTETGAYTLNGATSNANLMAVTRNTTATIFIPSEDEWYKAAYFNPANGSYWVYPTQSRTTLSNVLSASGTSNANYYNDFASGNAAYTDPINLLTPVGTFAGSPGPYGTYDMGGDVFQWNEAVVTDSTRGLRGGSWNDNDFALASTTRYDGLGDPTYNNDFIGFRLASLPAPASTPEPGALSLLACGCAVLFPALRRLRL